MKLELITHTPNPDKVVALAGKLCYSKVGVDGLKEKLTEKEIQRFVNMLSEIGHESPIEHISFTFAVEGVSRVLSHQLVRHRLASFSQQSQRYVKLDPFQYIVPPEIARDSTTNELYQIAMDSSRYAYKVLTERLIANQIREYWECEGVPYEELAKTPDSDIIQEFKNVKVLSTMEKKAIEDARYVLPNACETKLVFTMNARTLLNFLKNRTCNRSQWEIRNLAEKMLEEVRKVAPNVFKYAGASCVYETCKEGKMCCGQPRKDLRVVND